MITYTSAQKTAIATKAKIEIAKKMKAEKMDLEIIMKMTGLTKEEIEEL